MPLSSVVGAQSIIKPGVCTSSTKPASPFDGQVIYMTDVDQTAVWDGSQWTVLAPIAGGRNVIINGAMQVDQRGTASTAVTTNAFTVDRWYVEDGCDAVLSAQQSTDVPAGQGFINSLKVTATTADASIGATQFSAITQHIEGINWAQMGFGSATAKAVVASFWVKATATGTYSFTIYNNGAVRIYPSSFTVNVSNTWEKKTIAIPGDTTGTWTTDTGRGLSVNFYPAIGSTYQGSSGVWNASSIYGVTGQGNAWATVNNIFAVTGVQLEAGSVATPFEFEDIGTTLAKCQRYFQKVPDGVFSGYGNGTTEARFTIPLPVTLRSSPTLALSAGTSYTWKHNGAATSTSTSITVIGFNDSYVLFNLPGFSGIVDGYAITVSTNRQLTLSSEL